MLKAYTKYNKEFEYKIIDVNLLNKLVDTVTSRFNLVAFYDDLKSVSPEVFNRVFRSQDLNEIINLLIKQPNDIRRYGIRFSSQYEKNIALADFVSVGITFIRRSKFGDNDANEQKIVINGINCHEYDFNCFCQVCTDTLGLSKYYPPGENFFDSIVSEFIKSDFILPEAKILIQGAINTKQYDLAIKALSGIVESHLREKLIKLGFNEANNKIGVDLVHLAYKKDSGKLTPPWSVTTESKEGCHLMLLGFLGWIRNGFHHHSKLLESREGVLELIQLCNSIIKIIELSKQ